MSNENNNIVNLNNKLLSCCKCKRLVKFRNKIATEKRKQYISEEYWGKPVPGYGDSKAELMIIGLAPAAHGGNRTGRVFTGDKSSKFLFNCLYKAKISNYNCSEYKNDGLILKNTYLTLALKCVPPEDKPTKEELFNCFPYFREEINILSNVNVLLALGKIAFDVCIDFYKNEFGLKKSNYIFSHGSIYILPDRKVLIACYHPSPRNVNTGKINEEKMLMILEEVKSLLKTNNSYKLT